MLQLWRGWCNLSILRVSGRVLFYMGIEEDCAFVWCVNEMTGRLMGRLCIGPVSGMRGIDMMFCCLLGWTFLSRMP